jgi:membrane fusion protein, multidrug efflux system
MGDAVTLRSAGLLFALVLALGCGGKKNEAPKEAAASPGPPTPVRGAEVGRADLAERIAAPGKITAMAQAKIRAPFSGTLVELRFTDGDRVRKGEAVGSVISRDSEAALSGAREMERDARTPSERRDAARAVELARGNLVRSRLTASADGVVVSHGANRGDRVSEDEEILSIAEEGSLVVIADVPQAALSKIHPGESAVVEIAGREPFAGSVHDILPAGTESDLTAPVRIDVAALPAGASSGLFVTARIAVAEHRQALVVPDAAVLRDDVTGVARIAMIDAAARARWVVVATGLSDGGRTEIVTPALVPGTRVIVAGQVGLPEGAPVSVAP